MVLKQGLVRSVRSGCQHGTALAGQDLVKSKSAALGLNAELRLQTFGRLWREGWGLLERWGHDAWSVRFEWSHPPQELDHLER